MPQSPIRSADDRNKALLAAIEEARAYQAKVKASGLTPYEYWQRQTPPDPNNPRNKAIAEATKQAQKYQQSLRASGLSPYEFFQKENPPDPNLPQNKTATEIINNLNVGGLQNSVNQSNLSQTQLKIRNKVKDQQEQRNYFQNLATLGANKEYYDELRPTEIIYYSTLAGQSIIRKSTGTTNFVKNTN